MADCKSPPAKGSMKMSASQLHDYSKRKGGKRTSIGEMMAKK